MVKAPITLPVREQVGGSQFWCSITDITDIAVENGTEKNLNSDVYHLFSINTKAGQMYDFVCVCVCLCMSVRVRLRVCTLVIQASSRWLGYTQTH